MGANDSDRLALNVGRWGNSLAVRLPAELVRQLGIGEGDVLHLQAEGAGRWQMSAKPVPARMNGQQLLSLLQKHLERMPPTACATREMPKRAQH